jgi:hypothetical protein
LHALLFAARQSRDAAALKAVLQANPHLPEWCTEIINLEVALLENRLAAALPGLTRIHRLPVPAYLPYFQTERLLLHGHPDEADTVLAAYGSSVPSDEAAFLRLRIYHAKGWTALIGPEYDTLLRYPMTPRLAAKFCAYLLGHPDARQMARYLDKFIWEGPGLTVETIPLYQAGYLTAALAGDTARADRILADISKFTASDARVLKGLAELLKPGTPDPRLPRILPLVPLPTEVIYAILERPPVVKK